MSKPNGSAEAFAQAFQELIKDTIRPIITSVVQHEIRPLQADVADLKETVKNHGLQLDRIENSLRASGHLS